jgi:hypothetical protein
MNTVIFALAGARYCAGGQALLPELEDRVPLPARLEPNLNNQFDPEAIGVLIQRPGGGEEMIGYVPNSSENALAKEFREYGVFYQDDEGRLRANASTVLTNIKFVKKGGYWTGIVRVDLL